MPQKLNVLTGASGLLGSHIAEALRANGEAVRALLRPGSNTSFLSSIGVELMPCDLRDAAAVRRGVAGADIVYHCAARVGDWGTWPLFRAEIVDTIRNVVDACRTAAVGRLLHVSSVAVYGHPRARCGPITEAEPLCQHLSAWEHYCRAKARAERIARELGDNVTIVRPSWFYGPRDRNTAPRVIAGVRDGKIPILGRGDNLLNIVDAADVAAGAIAAANHPAAAGQIYHLSSEGSITQRDFLDALADELGVPRIQRRVPVPVAYCSAFAWEILWRLLGSSRPPVLTRYAVSLVGRSVSFSIAKARAELGWQPRIGPIEGMRRTVRWFLATPG